MAGILELWEWQEPLLSYSRQEAGQAAKAQGTDELRVPGEVHKLGPVNMHLKTQQNIIVSTDTNMIKKKKRQCMDMES